MAKLKRCRTCLGRSDGMVNIFEYDPNYLDVNIAEMISHCIRCPVSRGDSLPETICKPCLEEAKSAFDTIRKFERSHQFLKGNSLEEHVSKVLDKPGTTRLYCQDKRQEAGGDWPEEGSPKVIKEATIEGPSKVKIEDTMIDHPWIKEASTDELFPYPAEIAHNMVEVSQEGSLKQDQFQYQLKVEDSDEEFLEEFLEETSVDIPHFQVKNEPVEEDPSEEEDYGMDYQVKSEHMEEYVPEDTETGQEDTSREEVTRKYTCPQCPKQFGRMSALKDHIVVHTEEKPYECVSCSKRFKSARYLKEHHSIHTGERPFKCTHCSNSYRKKTCLQRHIQTYMGVRPFKCTHCPKTFAKDYDLQSHIRNYSGKKPYQCTVCSKTFATKSVLNVHARIHSGEKPFKCPQCARDFLWKSSLLSHMLRHSDEKPFTCSLCSVSYKEKRSLQRHMRIHKKK
nr:zinc finger protein 70-like [Drosophila suzukii]